MLATLVLVHNPVRRIALQPAVVQAAVKSLLCDVVAFDKDMANSRPLSTENRELDSLKT